MKHNAIIRAALAAAITSLLGLAACAGPKSDAALQAEAKLTKAQAEKIALTQAPNGKVVSSELEKEHGALVWTFDIASPGTKNITEVLVDAKTGKIVSTETETPAQQAKEAAEDKKAAKTAPKN